MSNRLIHLESIDLLHAGGPDTDRFLQGQLTCNIDHLSPERALPGAYCNLKGRVIADFIAVRTNDGIMLLLRAGMARMLRQALEKYAVFFKTTMTIVTQEWKAVGLLGNESEVGPVIPDWPMPETSYRCVQHGSTIMTRLPGADARVITLTPVADSSRVLSELEQHCETVDNNDWELASINAGMVQIDSDLSAHYTPQLLNHDINGVVDFRKGCYTGQEVVARMHYRGMAKKRLYRATAKGLTLPDDQHNRSLSIVDEQGKTCGDVVSRADIPDDGTALLVTLPCELAEAAIAGSCTLVIDRTTTGEMADSVEVQGTLPALPATLRIQSLQY